jgi:crotonobetainyl-CoA:carnitine CoA-transferase CaiB-like acyl-CoA transferase
MDRDGAAWARSGLSALTGWPDGPPLAGPAGLPARLEVLTAAIERASGVKLDWPALITRRAALMGWHRRGQVSANGTCRLLRTGDGWMALSLARPEDGASVPALLGREVAGDPWAAVDRAAADWSATTLVGRARLLGMAASVLGETADAAPGTPAPPLVDVDRDGHTVHGRDQWAPGPLAGLRVADLSALWAGPLAAAILADAGAEVAKVESRQRPDGARQTPEFYRSLHPDDQTVITVDLATDAGRQHLRTVLAEADIVIEASRPRALEQLGADPASLPPRPGRVWLSITGHGRAEPGHDWVAFGDDAAVAGGLVGWDHDGDPVFCGDAIADPLTGLRGALAALQAVATGGDQLIDLSLAGTAMAMTGRQPTSPVHPDGVGP